MPVNSNKRCINCGAWGVECYDTQDGLEDDVHCPKCNDKLIEQAKEREEWNYYHPKG